MDVLTILRNQRDRVAAWLFIGAGVLALVLGWVGVSGTPFPAEQIPYVVTGGLGGLFLLGLGAMLALSADLRDEWRKLDAIEELLRAGVAPQEMMSASGERQIAASARPFNGGPARRTQVEEPTR